MKKIIIKDMKTLKNFKQYNESADPKSIAWNAWKQPYVEFSGDVDMSEIRKGFEEWWDGEMADKKDAQTNENILPKSYKKVRCLECGEEVCDNLNYKTGHLYNKHNCKPSVDDYKALNMIKKYFI